MWLYLRFLHSELTGCQHQEYGTCECAFDSARRFRFKYNIMCKMQVYGLRIWLTILPFWTHKFVLRYVPYIENVDPNDKTKAIFGSAESMGLLEYPKKYYKKPPQIQMMSRMWEDDEPVKETGYYPNEDWVALSYSKGNRFVSWSGLVSFLYENHWQFMLILWSFVLATSAYFLGIFQWICSNHATIRICLI
jgi:hypothetical protein